MADVSAPTWVENAGLDGPFVVAMQRSEASEDACRSTVQHYGTQKSRPWAAICGGWRTRSV